MAIAAWPLRRKLALALAIPLLLASVLGGLRVSDAQKSAQNYAASSEQIAVITPAVDYLGAAERAMVAAQNKATGQADFDAAVAEIESAADALAKAAKTSRLTADQRYQVDTLLAVSSALREESATLSPGTWLALVRQLQAGTGQVITSIVNAQIEPEPRLELLSQALKGRFSLANQQALAATERTGETGSLELFAELGAEGAAIDRLAGSLGSSSEVVGQLRTDNASRVRSVRTKNPELGGAEAYAPYDALIGSLQKGIKSGLADAADQARRDALIGGAAPLGALALAILLAALIARALLTPIRKVREGALAVAHEQLPAAVARLRSGEQPDPLVPIDVATEEEIGQLARAVDDLHGQAIHLASGEAQLRAQVSDMFRTLSRRSTTLINQQLQLIESLERDEEDPRRLESLFRLDHLATRMRRTSDSLLILADAPTAGGNLPPMTVSDAMQAAMAGVADYRRARITQPCELAVSGAVSADVVHLLTELVDNALNFSDPGTSVALSATQLPECVVVQVSDQGLGIDAEALDAINKSLASGGEIGSDSARRMGLLVVARLAKRHGILVTLRSTPRQGTTASINLPSAILSNAERRPPSLLDQSNTTEIPVIREELPPPVLPRPLSSVPPVPQIDSEAPALPRRTPQTPAAPAAAAVPPAPVAPQAPAAPVVTPRPTPNLTERLNERMAERLPRREVPRFEKPSALDVPVPDSAPTTS
ncbi:MAG: sensor histidine kinase, partial [Nocardioides sp.]